MISEDKALFITGTSRSGTGLMQAIINRNSSYHVGAETHYFDQMRGNGSSSRSETVAAFFSRLSGGGRFELGEKMAGEGLSAKEILDAAEDDRLDSIFLAYVRGIARLNGKSNWGEKTPRHAFCLPELVRYFPNARFLHMVRDPRAVLASYRNWHTKYSREKLEDFNDSSVRREESRVRRTYNPILLSILWSSAARSAVGVRDSDCGSRMKIVVYEDLVSSPDIVVGSLMEWLGESYSGEMEAAPVTNSSFVEFSGTGGVQADFATRWRSVLPKRECAICEMLCGRLMRDLGYETQSSLVTRILAVPWIPYYAAGIAVAVAVNRKRLGNPITYCIRRLRGFLK